jgi:hypothetical protein
MVYLDPFLSSPDMPKKAAKADRVRNGDSDPSNAYADSALLKPSASTDSSLQSASADAVASQVLRDVWMMACM